MSRGQNYNQHKNITCRIGAHVHFFSGSIVLYPSCREETLLIIDNRVSYASSDCSHTPAPHHENILGQLGCCRYCVSGAVCGVLYVGPCSLWTARISSIRTCCGCLLPKWFILDKRNNHFSLIHKYEYYCSYSTSERWVAGVGNL